MLHLFTICGYSVSDGNSQLVNNSIKQFYVELEMSNFHVRGLATCKQFCFCKNVCLYIE